MSAPNALGSVAENDVNYTEETATTTTDVSTLGSNINILFKGSSGNNKIDISGGNFIILKGDTNQDISGVNPLNLSGNEMLRYNDNLITSANFHSERDINVSGEILLGNTRIKQGFIYNIDNSDMYFNIIW